jgi:hypothetical protein
MSGLFSTDNSQNYIVDNYIEKYEYSDNDIVRYDYYSTISGEINDLLLLTDTNLSNLNSEIFNNLITAEESYQKDISGYLYELSNNTVEFKKL